MRSKPAACEGDCALTAFDTMLPLWFVDCSGTANAFEARPENESDAYGDQASEAYGYKPCGKWFRPRPWTLAQHHCERESDEEHAQTASADAPS